MVDDMTPLPPDDAVLAAEYALSLLEGEELAAAEARMATDRDFAAEVAQWQAHFAELETETDPVAPPARVKRRLVAQVNGQPGRRWLRSTFGGLAGLAAAAGLAFVVFQTDLLTPQPEFEAQATLAANDRDFEVVASYDAETLTLWLERLAGDPGANARAIELWAIPQGGAPVSLGVVPEEKAWQVVLRADLAGRALTLALSDEPRGGSPTGAPTGAVVAAVPLQNI